MSRDSCHTYIHLHASHHADLFEEFCHPPSSRPSTTTNPNHTNLTTQTTSSTDPTDPDLTHIPGHFLPFESIHLPQHLMPVNPEDEDGVVPDMHAAFGIARAMGQGMEPSVQGERSGRGVLGSARVEEVWRDLGVERLVEGVGGLNVGGEGRGGGAAGVGSGVVNGVRVGSGNVNGVRREGRRGGILSVLNADHQTLWEHLRGQPLTQSDLSYDKCDAPCLFKKRKCTATAAAAASAESKDDPQSGHNETRKCLTTRKGIITKFTGTLHKDASSQKGKGSHNNGDQW